MSFSDLPVEILHIIAGTSYAACRAMLAVPVFARSLTTSVRWDYRVSFGETVEIYGSGYITICWKLNGWCHRVDGHAVEYADGTRGWFRKDKRHRIGAPAVIYADGSVDYYEDGRLHRTDGPAYIRTDGMRVWYINGSIHCETGPAMISPNGRVQYYFRGQLHRIGGPAVIDQDGTREYWIHGVRQPDQ